MYNFPLMWVLHYTERKHLGRRLSNIYYEKILAEINSLM